MCKWVNRDEECKFTSVTILDVICLNMCTSSIRVTSDNLSDENDCSLHIPDVGIRIYVVQHPPRFECAHELFAALLARFVRWDLLTALKRARAAAFRSGR